MAQWKYVEEALSYVIPQFDQELSRSATIALLRVSFQQNFKQLNLQNVLRDCRMCSILNTEARLDSDAHITFAASKVVCTLLISCCTDLPFSKRLELVLSRWNQSPYWSLEALFDCLSAMFLSCCTLQPVRSSLVRNFAMMIFTASRQTCTQNTRQLVVGHSDVLEAIREIVAMKPSIVVQWERQLESRFTSPPHSQHLQHFLQPIRNTRVYQVVLPIQEQTKLLLECGQQSIPGNISVISSQSNLCSAQLVYKFEPHQHDEQKCTKNLICYSKEQISSKTTEHSPETQYNLLLRLTFQPVAIPITFKVRLSIWSNDSLCEIGKIEILARYSNLKHPMSQSNTYPWIEEEDVQLSSLLPGEVTHRRAMTSMLARNTGVPRQAIVK